MTAKTVGIISEVHGPVVTVSCPVLPPLHQALETHTDGDHYLLEVYQHVDENSLRAIALHRASGLKRGLTVYDTGAPIHVPVNPKCLGRLLNIFGQPLDDGPSACRRRISEYPGTTDPFVRIVRQTRGLGDRDQGH